MNFNLTDDQKMFAETARQFADQELAPNAARRDREHNFPKELMAQAGQLGFCSIYAPESAGGLGLSRLDAAIIFEQLATGCTATTAMLTIHNMATWMVATWGTDEVIKQWCPGLTVGSQLASYCLTEPGSGSDAASLTTKAVRDGDHYVVNGAKMFISGAGETDVLVVMARTGEDGPKGISAFAVPADAEGIVYGKAEDKM
ncbi:MAG: acyl-CoA dehydrogenase family protein, partial [Psychrobium sp.]|nr:acyl-CoA dehydrogenase family protein [Psychrobium sp.]